MMDFRIVQHADINMFATLLETAISELGDLGYSEPKVSFSHTATPDPAAPYHYAAFVVGNDRPLAS